MHKKISIGVVVLISVVLVLPLIFIITGSFMSPDELVKDLAPLTTGGQGYAKWRLIPIYPTLQHYKEVLLDSPEFFVMFWNTVKITVGSIAGQLVIGIPAAWGLARYRFRGRKWIYMLYILLMMMPFQVTMLSDYLLLQKLHLMNSLWGIIIPAMFSAYPVFIMYRFFSTIPKEVLEAAELDGAGHFRKLWYIGLPLGKPGIAAAMFLSFIESYNMLEQPMAFLEKKSLWPLSLYLPEIGWERMGFAFAAAVIALILPMLVFAEGKDSLEDGIRILGVKK